MSVASTELKYATLLSTIGRSALNAQYPDEVELYVVALELVDDTGKTLKYFIFPVMPSNLEENQPSLTNIKKTAAGVTVLSTPTFVPVDISVSGTFGRRFRALIGNNFEEIIQAFNVQSTQLTADTGSNPPNSQFDVQVKTGYGCLKILESILKEADVVDANGKRRLIFYNPAFGTSYVVKPGSFKIAMSQETNMMHQYSFSLRGVAPLSAIQSAQQRQEEAQQLNTNAFVQMQTNAVINDLQTILAK